MDCGEPGSLCFDTRFENLVSAAHGFPQEEPCAQSNEEIQREEGPGEDTPRVKQAEVEDGCQSCQAGKERIQPKNRLKCLPTPLAQTPQGYYAGAHEESAEQLHVDDRKPPG